MAREQPLSRAEQAAGHVLMFDRVLEPEELAAEVDAVVAADLVRLTETILSSRRSAVAVLGPRASMKAAPAFEKALFG
jgi:predicted Zn-dependent peptidase